MFRPAAIILASLVFATAVLGTSILRTTGPNYAFSGPLPEVAGESTPSASIEYYLPYPGILPDHFLWPAKALRDRVWLFLTRDEAKRADLLLLFADKRVGMADVLIRGGKPELGVETAQKAGQYLEQALEAQTLAAQRGVDTAEFLDRLARSSLKHQEVLEALMSAAPEDARPLLNQAIDYPRGVYEKVSQELNERGRPVPTADFEPKN